MLFAVLNFALAGTPTDQAIVEAIAAHARNLDELSGHELEVVASDGTVEMSGTVPDSGTRRFIENHARSLIGVDEVNSTLVVENASDEVQAPGADDGESGDAVESEEPLAPVALTLETRPPAPPPSKKVVVRRVKRDIRKSRLVDLKGVNVYFEGDTLRLDGWVTTKTARSTVGQIVEDYPVESEVDLTVR